MIRNGKHAINWSDIIVTATYLIFGLVLLKYCQYQINPDGVSYISISRQYLNGHFNEAINGCWGPLLSWLLIPFLTIKITPLLAVKILSLLIGLFTLIGIKKLSRFFVMSARIRTTILITSIFIILNFAYSVLTPDLLLTTILIYYLFFILNPKYPKNIKDGLVCGFLGGLAYLTKSYAFFFFLGHFTLINLINYLINSKPIIRQKILKSFLGGLAIFLIISGIWIFLISSKYHKLAIGTGGNYTYAVFQPEFKGDPVLYLGFLKPPNKYAVNASEDPTYIRIKSWSPFDSISSFKHQLNLFRGNTLSLIHIYYLFSILASVIIAGYILICFQPLQRLFFNKQILYTLLTLLIYPVGYTLIYVEERYLWINYVLLLLMGGYMMNILFRSEFFLGLDNKPSKNTASFFAVKEYLFLALFALSFIPILSLKKDINQGKDYSNLASYLNTNYTIKGKIASNSNWDKTLYLAFYLNNQYYGQQKPNISSDELLAELKKHQIDYYFLWKDLETPKFLSNSKEITNGKVSGLKIFKLNEVTY